MILRIIYDSFEFKLSVGSMAGVRRTYGKANLTTSLVLPGRKAKMLLVIFFFHNCETHAMQGMDVLKGLKFVAPVPCNSTPDEVRDLFLQGYDMVIGVASEVKFFEVKLDEYAPAIPMTKLSDIRHYSGM
jgi:hypothetical protein